MRKTLPAVGESTRFSAILRGNKKAKARADEGSELGRGDHPNVHFIVLHRKDILLLAWHWSVDLSG